MNQPGQVGILKVHLFRPFSTEHFLAQLPQSVPGGKPVVVGDV